MMTHECCSGYKESRRGRDRTGQDGGGEASQSVLPRLVLPIINKKKISFEKKARKKKNYQGNLMTLPCVYLLSCLLKLLR